MQVHTAKYFRCQGVFWPSDIIPGLTWSTLTQHERCSCVFTPGGGGGVLPHMGYIGMCGAKEHGFSATLVINRVSILALLPPFW